jgi:hypothetical protein
MCMCDHRSALPKFTVFAGQLEVHVSGKEGKRTIFCTRLVDELDADYVRYDNEATESEDTSNSHFSTYWQLKLECHADR